MHTLIEVTPLCPADARTVTIGGRSVTIGGQGISVVVPWYRPTLRLSSAQDRAINGLNEVKWWPCIVRKPTISIRLFDGDFSSPVDLGQATFDLQANALDKLDGGARKANWAGAKVTIYAGESGDAWPWAQVFVGRISSFQAKGGKLSITASVDEEPFSADVLTQTYAGTGGLEGGADLKGKTKPWVLGYPQNIEPILIDSINSVFQVSAYGGIKAVVALYERGQAFSASYGNYATYADLVAAAIPAGRYATCNAQGLIRLGAPPFGVITADVQGDYSGSVWRRLPGAIIQRVCDNSSVPLASINAASLGALDTYAATLPGGGNISLYITEQMSIMDLARRIALSFNAQAGVSLLGKLFITRLSFSSPSTTLDAQQKQMPRVIEATESDVSPPYKRIIMGGQKCWRVHTFDEIAFGAELIDKGKYEAATVYREGNIVTLADGSRWVFVGATPLAGSAPTDVNANWSRMTDAVQAAAIQAAIDAAAAAQSTANAAQTAANNAQTSANTANADLANIASDNLLTPDEKPRVILDRDTIVNEQAGIDAVATTLGLTTEKTTYDNAVSALTSYLATLTTPVLWSDLGGNTTIVGTTFRTKFADVYAARQAIMNKFANGAAAASAGLNSDGTVKSGKVTAVSMSADVLNKIVSAENTNITATDAGALLLTLSSVATKPSQGGYVHLILTCDMTLMTNAAKTSCVLHGILQRSPAGAGTWTTIKAWRMGSRQHPFYVLSLNSSDAHDYNVHNALDEHTTSQSVAAQFVDTPTSDGSYDYRWLACKTSTPGTATAPEVGAGVVDRASGVALSVKVAS